MAAAVAKAPEKTKVPENPQVRCGSAFAGDAERKSPRPTFSRERVCDVSHALAARDSDKPLPGEKWKQSSMKPPPQRGNQSKAQNGDWIPETFADQHAGCGGGEPHGLQHQTLKTLRTNYRSEKVLWFQVPRWWSLKIGKAMTTRESCMEQCLSRLWLFLATNTLDVSKPQCMFCILKDYCSHLQKT